MLHSSVAAALVLIGTYTCAQAETGPCKPDQFNGLTCGEGPTLQDAADDLLVRLVNIALCVRRSGLRISSESGPLDRRLIEFIWELGEYAARGADIRERVFGPPLDADKVS